MKKIILLAALAMAGYGANAFAADTTGGYIRGEFGRSHVDVEGSSDNDQAFLIGGGYKFNKNFAVDGFWGNLYDDNDASLDGFGLGVVGKANFGQDGNGFYVDGRVGFAHLNGDTGIDSDSSTSPYFGVGVGYDVNDNVGFGVNWTRYNTNFEDADVDATTLNAAIEFRF